MFKAAFEADNKNVSALVNLGAIEFEYNNYEDAAIKFLDALDIKPDDEEALCNLALALKKTSYLDYAQVAFEEAVNVSPGNTFILSNYMMFLLEQKKFDQFTKVMGHARRVMDKTELDQITKLYDEFKAAIDGTEGKILPEDDRPDSMHSNMTTGKEKQLRGALKNIFGNKKAGGAHLDPIVEEF